MSTAAERSLIVKWSDPVVARRSRLVARRWLPAVGLEELRATAARRRRGSRAAKAHGRSTTIFPADRCRRTEPVDGEVEAAIDAIARVHTSFAEHPLLHECRLWGGDRGSHFYSSNVRDAVNALRSLDFDRSDHEAIAARDALLERMSVPRAARSRSGAQALAAVGGARDAAPR